MEAEEEAMEIPDRYTAAAADSISYGTFMKLRMQEDAEGDTVLHNMLRWLYANAEFSAAAVATELSVTRWADDDQFGFTGDHVWLPGATARLSSHLHQCMYCARGSSRGAAVAHELCSGITSCCTHARDDIEVHQHVCRRKRAAGPGISGARAGAV